MGTRIKTAAAKVLSLIPIAVALVTSAGPATAADTACPRLPRMFPSAHVSALQIHDLVTHLVSGDGLQCIEFGPHEVQCDSPTLPEVWIFTQPGHPAYPAVSRGVIVRNGTLTCVMRDGYFAGNESAFRAWMAELVDYDNHLIEKVRRQP